MEVLTTKSITFGDFAIDAAKRRLLKKGEVVPLNSKTFDLLMYLAENRGKVISKDELLEKVWADQFVEENNLTVQISALRKIFGERKGENEFIRTVRGEGYSFVAELNEPEPTEIIIESHSFSRIVFDEEVNTYVKAANGASGLPKIATSLKSRFKENRFVILLTTALLLLATSFGGYFWQREQASKNPVPFQQISIKRLTTNGKITNAAFSPDGKLYVYSIENLKSLWLGHTAGGEPIELRPPADVAYRSLRFSSDSNTIYYVVTGKEYPTGALFRLPVFGGVPEKLRENIRAQVTFSPDMSQFAFVNNAREKGTSTLVIANTGDAATRKLTSRPAKFQFEVSSPAWSADGKTIAVSAISEVSGGTNYEVFAVTVADGQIKQLTTRKFRSIPSLAWLNNGSGLVMTAEEQPLVDHQLWYVSYPDGAARQINPDLNSYGSAIGISADGNTLLAVKGEYLANVWIAPAHDLAQARQITFSAIGGRNGRLGLEWMPGGRLIYAAFADKSQSLWMMNMDGSNQKQLTPDGFIDLNPSVTADGRVVVFGSNRSGTFEVWRVNSDGGDLRQLTFSDDNEMPGVSPDGKWVVYISTRDGLNTVWRVPLEGGGEPVRLSDRPSSWVRVSPDSRFVACGYNDNGKTRLAVLPIEGGEPVKLFDLPPTANLRYALRWMPDGKALTYRDWENGYWRQSLAGGEAQRIENLPEEKLFAYSWSPDGKQFAFTRGAEIRDIVLISNLR